MIFWLANRERAQNTGRHVHSEQYSSARRSTLKNTDNATKMRHIRDQFAALSCARGGARVSSLIQ